MFTLLFHPLWLGHDCLVESGTRRPAMNQSADDCAGPRGESRRMLKILLADDHRILRHGLREILQSLGPYEIVGEAVDGPQTLAQALRWRPDIIIMDIGMPGLNGIETTSALKTALPETRILVLTMHEHLDLIAAAFEAGAQGYMIKTESDQEMARALKLISRGYIVFSPRVAALIIEEVRRHPRFDLRDPTVQQELALLDSVSHCFCAPQESIPFLSVELFNATCRSILARLKGCLG
jgi:DNA-binding NarL/FixJ family response regulator